MPSFLRRDSLRRDSAVTYEQLATLEVNRQSFSGRQLEDTMHSLPREPSTRLPVSIPNESLESLQARNRRFEEEEDVVSTSCYAWLSPRRKTKHAQRVIVERFATEHTSEPFSRLKREHEDELQKLWRVSKQEEAPPRGAATPDWKLLGFQGDDPATDLSRSSSGLLSVRALLFFANTCPGQYADALERSQHEQVENSYPFACAAMHLTDMLLKMMGAIDSRGKPGQYDSQARKKLASMLVASPSAFFDVFTIAFILLDTEWQRQNGTYFQFNAIMESVKARLGKALRQRAVGTPSQLAQALPVPWQREPSSVESSVEPSPRQ